MERGTTTEICDAGWEPVAHPKDLKAVKVRFTAVGMLTLQAGSFTPWCIENVTPWCIENVPDTRFELSRISQATNNILQQYGEGFRLYEPLTRRRTSSSGDLLYEVLVDEPVVGYL